MKVLKFDDRDAWMAARRGRITGSRAGDVVSASSFTKEMISDELTRLGVEFDPKKKKEDLEALLPLAARVKLRLLAPKKLGYYELIAERLGVPPEDESDMTRGTRLESEAVERFVTETKKKADPSLVIWVREDNDSIAVSPDASIGKTAAVEAKCLSSARHIEAFLTQKIPSEYHFQKLQYFITNENLKTLYWVFYDPRILAKPFFFFEVKRSDVQDEVDEYLAYQRALIDEVNVIVNNLTF